MKSKTISFIIFSFLSLGHLSLNAQRVTTYASALTGSPIVHISQQFVYSSGVVNTYGFYSNGTVMDDTQRVLQYGIVLNTTAATDSQVAAAQTSFWDYGQTTSYNVATANCGNAADAGASSIPSARDSSSYNAIAITGSVANYLCGDILGPLASAWNAFCSMFE
jgi:hypothetical protein